MADKYGPNSNLSLIEAQAFYSSCQWGVHGTLVRDSKTGVLECLKCYKRF